MFFLRFYTMDNDIIFPEVKRRQVVPGYLLTALAVDVSR
jgi:hypothetical protein